MTTTRTVTIARGPQAGSFTIRYSHLPYDEHRSFQTPRSIARIIATASSDRLRQRQYADVVTCEAGPDGRTYLLRVPAPLRWDPASFFDGLRDLLAMSNPSGHAAHLNLSPLTTW